jgi:hypothetical protein
MAATVDIFVLAAHSKTAQHRTENHAAESVNLRRDLRKQFVIFVNTSHFLIRLYYTCLSINYLVCMSMPIPVAARSKAWVYGRSLAGIVGSNPA